MPISSALLVYVSDADFHTKMHGIDHSTDLREIVTIGHMLDNPAA